MQGFQVFILAICLLQTSFTEVSTADKIISVQRGKSVLLFENVGCAGGGVTLYINGNKNHINILTWTFGNAAITAHWRENYTKVYMDHNQNIRIDSVDESYKGKYSIQCNDSEEIKVELRILEPLSVDISGLTVAVMQKQILMTCTVIGSGDITVRWSGPNDDQLFNSFKYAVCAYNSSTRQSSLTIKNLTASDAGKYTCHGTDDSGIHNASVTQLTVIPALTVSIDNGEKLITTVGSNASITCSAYVTGTISIVWIGPINNILTNTSKYSVDPYNPNTRKSMLTIFALSTTDSGLYICQGTDGFGSTAQVSITLTAYVPLSVSIDNGNSVTGVSGGSITIICTVSGTGTITVTWFGPLGNIISSGPKYTVSSYDYKTGKSNMTVWALNKSDAGPYICRTLDISNSQFEDSIYVSIPESDSRTTPPVILPVVVAVLSTATISIILFIFVKYKKYVIKRCRGRQPEVAEEQPMNTIRR